ncbi:TFIID-18kDa-domain-containing protein [Rickenella mellea]|uniref:Transcription initiation factor TFIID subunit 13 n=1 Tax=Rickenella mellea TaxID=50990 RepID=A0A4Y7QBM3_9AGAM|nr:TFIID-18kDa-domain-containing protein [Rickenella mellea]
MTTPNPNTFAYPAYQPYPGQPAYQYPAWPYSYSYPRPPQPAQQQNTAPTYSTAPAATFSSYTPTYPRDPPQSSTAGTTRGPRKQSNLKGLFAKELPKLMYGFGDDKQVSNDTVNVMEEILVEYIVDVCQTALSPTRKARLQIEDLRRALGRPADAKKLARMEELLFMQEDIKRARSQFNDAEGGGIDNGSGGMF